MEALRTLTQRFPDAARDIRLNLLTVLQEGELTPAQRFTIALAVALAAKNRKLVDALQAAGREHLNENAIDDAQAAATLMAMTNVYYRFRHMVGDPAYESMPARLRMQRLAQPKTDKVTFELASLAVSATAGCERCVRSHEAALRAAGVAPAQIHDAVRIAAVVNAAACAVELTPDGTPVA